MAFYFLDNVFLLHFAFKAPQSIFQGLTFLNPYFCQSATPPNLYQVGLHSYVKLPGLSQVLPAKHCQKLAKSHNFLEELQRLLKGVLDYDITYSLQAC